MISEIAALGPNPQHTAMEKYKNLLQLLIWQHNRLDQASTKATCTDIAEAYKMGQLTYHQCESLLTVAGIFLNDYQTKTVEAEEKLHAAMA